MGVCPPRKAFSQPPRGPVVPEYSLGAITRWAYCRSRIHCSPVTFSLEPKAERVGTLSSFQ
jgi:hypothetical protein